VDRQVSIIKLTVTCRRSVVPSRPVPEGRATNERAAYAVRSRSVHVIGSETVADLERSKHLRKVRYWAEVPLTPEVSAST
jgi:hypothetical protein